MQTSSVPGWLKPGYTLLVCIIVPVYWQALGPSNFLWFSDIALITLVPAVWLENRLLSSTMAVSVLFLELAWVVDFVSGGELITIAAYMFAEDEPWLIRWLSGSFHLVLPPLLIFLLYRLGYDRRALPLQILIALIVLPLTFVLTTPSDNINWVYGLGQPQQLLPPLVYLCLFFLALVLLVYLPSHLVLKRFFSADHADN
jgi:hypothetical protein